MLIIRAFWRQGREGGVAEGGRREDEEREVEVREEREGEEREWRERGEYSMQEFCELATLKQKLASKTKSPSVYWLIGGRLCCDVIDSLCCDVIEVCHCDAIGVCLRLPLFSAELSGDVKGCWRPYFRVRQRLSPDTIPSSG